LNVTPVGSVPLPLNVGDGEPVAVSVKVPATPTVNELAFELVMAAAWFTVNVKLCAASVPTPLVALIVTA
jgi:hypothetical protein